MKTRQTEYISQHTFRSCEIGELFAITANQKKPRETADLADSNAVIVNVMGVRLLGREEFYQFIKKAMEGALSELVAKNEIIDIRFIRADVAVVSAIQKIATNEGAILKEHGNGSVTWVLVKEHGKWQVAVAQNTMIGQWE